MAERSAGGMPGLAGVEHIGFTVPNLEQATRFFVDVIGCVEIYKLGPFQFEDDWMRQHLDVHPRSIMRELRFFRCGHGPNFEIFEYEAEDQRKQQPANSDVGGHHLAFYVHAMEPAIAHLKRHDIRVLGEPTARMTGPSGGQSWVYFLSPWGMQLELVSFPQGKAYEAAAPVKLWHPANPSA